MSLRLLQAGASFALLTSISLRLFAAEEDPTAKTKTKDDKSPVVSLGDDPATAMKKFSLAPGLKIEVFAAEPLIQDVVNFTFDGKGRAYVVETGRRRTSVFDIRSFRSWVDDDFQLRTVDDRANFYKQHVSQDDTNFMASIGSSKIGGFMDFNKDGRLDWHDLEVETERLKLVWDSDGDGKADKSTVFADGFNTLISGVAAGVVTRKGDVWFACIPDLVRLRDTDDDGVADYRTNLIHGFGVHVAYGGHDMHGLKFGPDGKIYWTIADRGTSTNLFARVKHKFPGLTPDLMADAGAVFRANPDGSDFEVVATGLRNPQELAFDQYGNLFTGDNNADGGDKARWEYVVEGGDYGWRYGWQHLPKLGAWNSEMLWGLAASNTAAYLLPPVAHIGHGPAGITYYPGTGMPAWCRDHFFYADFPGGIRHFKLEPRGATFTVDNPGEYLLNNAPDKKDGKLVWGLYPTDIEFGPGGGAYVLDWVQGWEKTGKGRLYHIFDPDMAADPEMAEVKQILAEGMDGRTLPELASLLGHVDQRVRQEAQFAIVERNGRKVWKWKQVEVRLGQNEALNTLRNMAHNTTNQLARLHAIWGLGQIEQVSPGSSSLDLIDLLRSSDVETRAQAAKVIGSAGGREALGELLRVLKDPSPRVQFFAAQALGKLGHREAVPYLVTMLRNNADADAFVRHAGVLALAQLNDKKSIVAAAHDASPSVRLAALLVMRRLAMPEISLFLHYEDPQLVLEAARAIHDTSIPAALPKLAALLDSKTVAPTAAQTNTAILRRAINANFRLGGPEQARALGAFAALPDAAPALRAEAVEALGDWAHPPVRDRVTGLGRRLPERDGAVAGAVLQPLLSGLLTGAPEPVRLAAISAIEKLGLREAADALFSLVSDVKQPVEVRTAALKTLAVLKDARLGDALKLAQADKSEALRKEASRLLGAGNADDAARALGITLETGSIGEKQAALQTLAGIKGKPADDLIRKWLDKLLGGSLPKELQLDVIEAAAKRSSPSIKEKLQRYESGWAKDDALAGFRETLYGGDAKDGRKIFLERAEAACARCHKFAGEGGDVGPELTGIGSRKPREYILESIVAPNAQIAPGFENLLIRLKSGTTVTGVVKKETSDELIINSPEDGLVTVKKSNIEARQKGLSSMLPELGTILTKQEIRDIIEFLATSK